MSVGANVAGTHVHEFKEESKSWQCVIQVDSCSVHVSECIHMHTCTYGHIKISKSQGGARLSKVGVNAPKCTLD